MQTIDLVQELRHRGFSEAEACTFLDTRPDCSFQFWSAFDELGCSYQA